MGAIVPADAYSVWSFLIVTLAIGGWIAFVAGRAVASSWRGVGVLFFYVAGIAAGVRFLHYAVFRETLLSPQGYAIDYGILLAIALVSWRLRRAAQMSGRYGWLFARTGPFTWSESAGRDAR